MRYLWIIATVIIVLAGFNHIYWTDRHAGLGYVPWHLELTHKHLATISSYLHAYKKNHGAYPSMGQGLGVLSDLAKARKANPYPDYDSGLRYLRVAPSGVLSFWGEPFIYENRNGLPASAFATSGAAKDSKREYSIKVDDGVYVWSLAAQQEVQKRDYITPRLRIAGVATIIAALLCFAAFLCACWRSVHPNNHGLDRGLAFTWSAFKGLAAGAIIAVFFLPTLVATCYEGHRMARLREPRLTADYLAVMRKYRDSGAISESAYAKLVRALEADEESPDYRKSY